MCLAILYSLHMYDNNNNIIIISIIPLILHLTAKATTVPNATVTGENETDCWCYTAFTKFHLPSGTETAPDTLLCAKPGTRFVVAASQRTCCATSLEDFAIGALSCSRNVNS